jgi:succinate dehydrogenase / fumarate reductase cytochrome b subunit
VNSLISFFTSSIGRKWIVALTGLVLIAYVLGHLAGNLQIFIGQDQINKYAKGLHDLGALLWVARIGLIIAFVLHIVTTIKLVMENRAARPERYAVTNRRQATFAARTMAISGLIVLCFVIYHLLHFTTRDIDPSYKTLHDSLGRHDTYGMMIRGFQNPLASAFYLLGVFLLCLHLSHGFSSFMQTLGLNSHKVGPLISNGGRVLAWLIFAGYASIPLAVLIGYLR